MPRTRIHHGIFVKSNFSPCFGIGVYKENGLDFADPLPADAMGVGRGELDAELILCGMLNGIFVLAAREGATGQILALWTASAARAGLSAALAPWQRFVGDLFISNTVDAERAVRDASLSWPWRGAASVKVAVDAATRPAELLTIHSYWTNEQARAATGPYILLDIERLVTSGWQRLSVQSFLLRAPAVTVPALLQACASASTGWRKIGEVLAAACDVVPGSVPAALRERFRALQQ